MRWVKRGDLLGLSPSFDDLVVLSPIDGTIEGIEYDSEERAVRIVIRQQDVQWQAAHP
jgi:Na+-translocating ferredoxin:NAD+ oxidoreductase RnfC subunit